MDPDAASGSSDAAFAQGATRRQTVIGLIAAAGALGTSVAAYSFNGAVRAARRRISGRSALIETRFGRMEYAAAGAGPPLLMIHGTGGGFDQGLSFAAATRERGVRIVAPSRFGYLRSAFPADPSSENQADAFVMLLDHLGIGRIVAMGGSAGALSAVQFALRHPARCAGLILLVPAANVTGRDPVEMTAFQEFLVKRLSSSDFLYWTALNLIPDRLTETLLATDPALLDRVSPEERARARRILAEILPVSARTRGMRNDGRLAGHPARVDFRRIAVPTLVISVEDDRFGTAATAREIAGRVPGARLIVYPSGGHIWLGRDDEVADQVARFVTAHSPAGRSAAADVIRGAGYSPTGPG
jgi:2-hydroxy-6-oxonona-2,4-dienedioate hydrolase